MGKIQYMVHDFKTESVVFRGTEQECTDYINAQPIDAELELYWAKPGEPHYKEEDKDCGICEAFTKRDKRLMSPYERTKAAVYATGNKWAIENFHATHD